MNSLDCELESHTKKIPILYLKLIVGLSMPIIYFCVLIFGIIIYSLITKMKRFPYYMMIVSALFLIIYIQPDIVSSLISQVACVKIGNTYYILADNQFECFTSSYYSYSYYLILPFFIVWIFVIPLTLFFLLRRKKKSL